MTEQRCRTCTWWRPDDSNEWGECRLTTVAMDENEWAHDERGLNAGHAMKLDHPESLALTDPWADGEYCGDLWCGGSLKTRHDFGCIQHVPKEK